MFNFNKNCNVVNHNALISTSNSYLYIPEGLITDDMLLTIDFIELFDKVVVLNDKKLLSKEQRKLVEDYLNEIVNFSTEELDRYFGGYLGETTVDYYYTRVVKDNGIVSLSGRLDD